MTTRHKIQHTICNVDIPEGVSEKDFWAVLNNVAVAVEELFIPSMPEEYYLLASASNAQSKASWAFTQTTEFGRTRTIISVDSDEALVIYRALDNYIQEYQDGIYLRDTIKATVTE